MEKKISVIIPVYNTEEYIRDCVTSVLEQTFQDFEIILINDGSQDNSGELCERLCTEDQRIRVIRQDHKGVSVARNAGIDVAKGKYLFFLDSDDIIHPQLLETLYRLQEKNRAIISATEFCYVRSANFQKFVNWKKEQDHGINFCYLNQDKARKPSTFAHPRLRLDAIGGKMILSEAIGQMRFDEELTHGEDTLFLHEMIANGADVTVLFRKWYFYRRTERNYGKEYSVESCKSRWEVQRRLRDHEWNNNRTARAVYEEWILLCEIVLWYEMGRKNQDDQLVKYIEDLIKVEKKSWLYSQVDWGRRIVFHLGCVCYPLYKIIADFFHWYHHTLDLPRELRGK
ncbi:MAG: glycosyltransferase [Lachnospiraceae bacterium]